MVALAPSAALGIASLPERQPWPARCQI